MSDTAPNGHIARNTLLLAAVAAGCGWLLYARASNPTALAEGARDLGRSLKQRLDDAGTLAEGVVERVQSLTARQRPPRVVPRKIAVDEPMAGYGA